MADIENLVPTRSNLSARSNLSELTEFNYETFIPINLNALVASPIMQKMLKEMHETGIYNKNSYQAKYKASPKKIDLHCEYIRMVKSGMIDYSINMDKALRSFECRSNMGVNVFTLVMSDKPFGQKFTCAYNCYYCPAPPGMPRSYLVDEPAVRRGYNSISASNDRFDPDLQIYNRFSSYLASGQFSSITPEIIKGEFILEGGTYSSYPARYREWFMTRIYYTCNTIYDSLPRREPLSLDEEVEINKTVKGIRIVGLSVETRPDTVNEEFIRECRRFGVTKVQIGVQHTDDEIMNKLNRKCTISDVKRAMKVLIENGFKIQIHLMPDLPGSNPEKDMEMFREIYSNPEYGFDHVKVYPCMVLPFTLIKKWYESGKYVPYATDEATLVKVMMGMIDILRENNRYDIRVERLVRDMAAKDVIAGCKQLDLGDVLIRKCKEIGKPCICIRCREIGSRKENEYILVNRSRTMCGSQEQFLSVETVDNKHIFGFLRLRIPSETDKPLFESLKQATIIREVHIYGSVAYVGKEESNAQHKGFGTILVNEAKRISKELGFSKIAVISGVGVMEYYKNKHEFVEDDGYMTCKI
jgi:ELP3 family radical SAM enzyme/protein acetyltransferase